MMDRVCVCVRVRVNNTDSMMVVKLIINNYVTFQ